mmetsp:Transcript_31372/g.91941  ORF Transcript_31372/g.91941 Transcript_31372/m.91941 type:complete len:282 (-) Transcript_31372:2421-3266(-)
MMKTKVAALLQKRNPTPTRLCREATIRSGSFQVRPRQNSMPTRSRLVKSRRSSNGRCRSGWSRSVVRPIPRRRCWCESFRITRRNFLSRISFGGISVWKWCPKGWLVVVKVQSGMCPMPIHLPLSPALPRQAHGPSDAGRCFEARVPLVIIAGRRSSHHRRSSPIIPRPWRSSSESMGWTFASFACTCKSTTATTRLMPIPVPSSGSPSASTSRTWTRWDTSDLVPAGRRSITRCWWPTSPVLVRGATKLLISGHALPSEATRSSFGIILRANGRRREIAS